MRECPGAQEWLTVRPGTYSAGRQVLKTVPLDVAGIG